MKHDTDSKGKFRKLVRRLRPMLGDAPVSVETVAVGILERLWHATIRSAPCGDIGQLDNELIADCVGWNGDPDELISALVECGWLDPCPVHRLVVHDWPDHCPDFLKGNLRSHKRQFAIATCPEQSAIASCPEQPAIARGIPNLTQPNLTQPNQKAASAACTEPPQTADSMPSSWEWRFPVTGKDGKDYVLPEAKLSEYLESYPTLNVPQELRKARQWLRDKPANRKTRRGTLSFLTRWLNRAVDNGRPPPNGSAPAERVDMAKLMQEIEDEQS